MFRDHRSIHLPLNFFLKVTRMLELFPLSILVFREAAINPRKSNDHRLLPLNYLFNRLVSGCFRHCIAHNRCRTNPRTGSRNASTFRSAVATLIARNSAGDKVTFKYGSPDGTRATTLQ